MAGTLTTEGQGYSLTYEPQFIEAGVAIDPIALKLGTRPLKTSSLPGVIADAKPSGYGQDRLNARHGLNLSPMELLESGAGDGAGAIAVCEDVLRKQVRSIPTLDDLERALERLDEGSPDTSVIREVGDDLDTSVGGDVPKMTLSDENRLWLAKFQDRLGRQGMPALEFVAMTLAGECGIRVPPVRLVTAGGRQVLLVERFDRYGPPLRPCRLLFASAHTVLRLHSANARFAARRSYLDFAYEAKRWGNLGAGNTQDMAELWRRMAFNALVGNVDDHPRNHGLLLVNGTWRLAPAFDITPCQLAATAGDEPWPALAMTVHISGSAEASPHHLLASAPAFGVDLESACNYLRRVAATLVESWEVRLREALAPLSNPAVAEQVVSTSRVALAMAERLATRPIVVDAPYDELLRQRGKRSRAQKMTEPR